MAKPRIDHDRLFKELLSTFFEEFLLLFFPNVYEHIDVRHLSFLTEELFTDVTAGEKHRVDLLVETKMKGEEGLIIVHVEHQSYAQRTFPERMFLYFSRLFQKYRRRILPIAIFSYDEHHDEPSSLVVQFPFLTVLDFRFLTVELRKLPWREYIRRDNPVAAALLSKMGYNESEKVEVKKEFLRMLVRLELDEAKQRLLFGFFETYLRLSEAEEIQLRNEVSQMETKEAKQVMELIISYEQRGIEKGIQQGVKQGIEQGLKQGIKQGMKQGMKQGIEQGRQKGIEEGKIDIAKKMLAKGYDVDTIHELTGLPVEKIERVKG
ncbi:transposase [Geobacillus thermoleovorans]|uniref:Transposase n=1 Tax=Geobacillus thermoleovorans TaxID=33941 RepID=A0A2Z3N816_GEOTH|nr:MULTISPECIES: Rpn family recombination-promoting nuclease/putative transposase [Geobacillus thermoleovorans group]AWO75027.1 transposase [Geobacillus thermoleovorans]MED3666688.1 Rpn family recombination-promoting nuclease/putative transposase [Geobacillus kaustophilus]MED4973699.1 Rpn family recombination-promoting nuclease/putative transposase [Geobacillus thermoleovorans]QCK83954.1 transposase [Geobacillus kaustophilus NBRC 102445]QNU20814.1 Rpn family recombination-promoting nuclease/pu